MTVGTDEHTEEPDPVTEVIALVRERGYQRRDEPFTLASGATSHDYVDGKRCVDRGGRLLLACHAILQRAAEIGADFDAVGGMTMGADPFAHGVAFLTDRLWFSIRKQPKGRGLDQWIEGARLDRTHRVLLVDDVITTGGSTITAYEKVLETGATVTGVVPFVDRSDLGREAFAARGVPYAPVVGFRDLGIEAVRLPA